jgi:hypothetical protein
MYSVHDQEASSVYFALNLKKDDTVKINSGTVRMYTENLPVKFMGFLIE